MLLQKFNFWISFWGALLFWFLSIVGISALPQDNLLLGLSFFGITFALACYIMEGILHIPSHSQKLLKYSIVE